MPSPFDALDLPFMRTALAELALLGVAGGLLGTWIVLRELAFFTHAVGTATFPGLVVADAAGIAPQLAGAAVALGYTGGVERTGRSGRGAGGDGAATGLLLVGALALGVVLASDVLESGAGVDRLLFGTLVGVEGSDVAASGAAAVAAVAATGMLGRAWFATGFDPAGSRALGIPSRRADAALLLLVALAVVAALPAVGALLVAAVFIVPAATARLLTRRVGALLALSVALAVAEGVLGLYLAYWLDVSPGPAVATLGAAVYAAVTVWSRR
ncbi:MAG: metal ABC transporter permease [Thermoleophilaceae bacterium]